MACGTSGNQFKNAPLAGQFLKAIIDAEAAGLDHDVEPVQFVGAVTGRSIDLAAFSRRRDKSEHIRHGDGADGTRSQSCARMHPWHVVPGGRAASGRGTHQQRHHRRVPAFIQPQGDAVRPVERRTDST